MTLHETLIESSVGRDDEPGMTELILVGSLARLVPIENRPTTIQLKEGAVADLVGAACRAALCGDGRND
ncbi:MAG: hypothetical protein JNM43_22585 [Planctomycetaceae bacterium]|nr:hypothetical protein [Planctomycetaceae bacterium]